MYKFLILTLMLGLLPFNFSLASSMGARLKGKILLQVEGNGEAWYVNPADDKRYFLGRPADAFQMMRDLGLGISNKDFDSFGGYAPERLSGRILLKVEDNGKAYYVNPGDLKMHYLGRPADAFNVMRELGMGITNTDLSQIEAISGQISVDENGPTQAYLKYLQALADYDIDTLEDLSIEGLEEIYNNQEQIQQALDLMNMLQPVNIKVVNEIIESEKAILRVQGENNPQFNLSMSFNGATLESQGNTNVDDSLNYGTVALQKINNEWKLYKEKWVNPSPVIEMGEDDDEIFWDVRHFCNNQASVSSCEGLDWDFEKSMCYECFATLNSNSDLCTKTSEGFDRDSCYLAVAEVTGDQNLCTKISDEYGYKDSCEDSLELSNFLTGTNIFTMDSDGDGLSDAMEIQFFTDMNNPDTDGDGYPDGIEVKNRYSPKEKPKVTSNTKDIIDSLFANYLLAEKGCDIAGANSLLTEDSKDIVNFTCSNMSSEQKCHIDREHEIKYDNDTAVLYYAPFEHSSVTPFFFTKENGEWKIDLYKMSNGLTMTGSGCYGWTWRNDSLKQEFCGYFADGECPED